MPASCLLLEKAQERMSLVPLEFFLKGFFCRSNGSIWQSLTLPEKLYHERDARSLFLLL
jgi:hypothetical protein